MSALGAGSGMQRFVREYLRVRPGERVLDLGCGPGRLYPALPRVEYCGLDVDAGYLARARALFRSESTCGFVPANGFSTWAAARGASIRPCREWNTAGSTWTRDTWPGPALFSRARASNSRMSPQVARDSIYADST